MRAILIILGVLMMRSATHSGLLSVESISAILFTLATFVLFGTTPWWIRRYYLRAARNYSPHTDPKTCSFGDDGLMIADPTSSASLAWSRIKRITENTRYFYLHANRIGWVILLPKAAFDAEKENIFRQCSQSVPRT